MGLLECDDANTRSGDGCSAECYVEPYYECKGGGPSAPDICIERKPPEILLFKYYANRSATILFSEPVKISSKSRHISSGSLSDIMQFRVVGGESGSVAWTHDEFNPQYAKKLIVHLNYNYSLSGSEVLNGILF